jgi:hypothetical protein
VTGGLGVSAFHRPARFVGWSGRRRCLRRTAGIRRCRGAGACGHWRKSLGCGLWPRLGRIRVCRIEHHRAGLGLGCASGGENRSQPRQDRRCGSRKRCGHLVRSLGLAIDGRQSTERIRPRQCNPRGYNGTACPPASARRCPVVVDPSSSPTRRRRIRAVTRTALGAWAAGLAVPVAVGDSVGSPIRLRPAR